MLRGLRKASGNWVGKIIMGIVVSILVLSFAIWGVGDIFRGFGLSTLATVGSTEIGVEQFRQIYNERMQQFSAQIGRPIPPDQARALGLDRQILGQITAEVALDERARQLKLGISDQQVASAIRDIPSFRGPSGQFDHAYFEMRIRSAGFTERRFVAEQRKLMVRNHLTDSIANVSVLPNAFLDAVTRYQNERRTIEYAVLGAAQAGDIPSPTPEQIATFYEERKNLFRAPEYRSIVVAKLAPEDVSKWTTITDEEARKFYDERRGRFESPPQRQIQQIRFINPEDAEKASARIKEGTPFEAIAQERGVDPNELGTISNTEEASRLRGKEFVDAVFALPEGGVSAPIKTTLGTVIIRVAKIEPTRVRSFDEAKDEIKQELARDRVRAEVNEKHDKTEDERAGGQSVAAAAQKIGLTAQVIQAIDRNGRDPGGAEVPDLPARAELLRVAFSTDVGIEADPLRLPDGGYVWFDVTGITPARDRNLEEVKDQVEARWRETQVSERLTTKANAMVEKLKAGASLAEVAQAENVKAETAADLRRSSTEPSTPAVAAAFTTPKGEAASAEGRTPGERIVLRVTEVAVPSADAASPEGKQIQDNLRNAIGEDLLREYVTQVEREIGTTVNADALRRAVGGEAL
jgi:peptidyl-prolyl cis-trans isomerase D